jgi:hypothetical protein
MDVDLLGYGESTPEAVAAIVAAVPAVEVPEDALTFDLAVRAEEIRGGREYGGVRVRGMAFLGNARIPLQIDVGFGDAVHPIDGLAARLTWTPPCAHMDTILYPRCPV